MVSKCLSSTFSDVDNNSELIRADRDSYETDGKEIVKPLLSDGWENVFDDPNKLFRGGVDDVRLACQKYCLKTGYRVTKVKNDRERFTMKCSKVSCTWMIHAVAIDSTCDVFRIKKYVGRHTCGAGVKLRSPKVSKKLVHNLIHDRVIHNPLIKPREIEDYIKVGDGVNIKYHHAYHGLERSHHEIFGNDVKSYSDLVWWVNSLKETNPGSYVDFQLNDATQTFERLFIAIGACIEGYRLCRPMTFVDATFLTGRFRGNLMAATCLNGNQGFYPLAFALVLGEDVDNWDWFMCNLSNIVDDRPITFMSDRHEGLLRAIPKHFPTSHHGYCYYHLQGNLPIRKSDEKYKEVMACFKKATYALTPARYEEALMEMELMGRHGVAEYCRNMPREHWSSALFTGCIFGQTTSSVAESFNNWIRKDKRLPACALVDMIRLRVMELMNERREMSLLMDPEKLTPTYEALLKEHIQIGRVWNVTQSSAYEYEIHSPRSHTVDLLNKTCTCQRWRVYGFPCSHATATISAKGDRYVDYIEDYFKVTNFQQLYSIAIRLIPNYNRLEQYLPEDTIFPPHPRVPTGRPKGNRIKNAWEKLGSPFVVPTARRKLTTTRQRAL
ncbi:protein FAR1-RELATED SEQUENCE 6-like [Papaver somniferum]|uniref:protein FAR1-RELATED SEQUENCE 6-like n=1 Tax=Papaver somniferum TaxID=3469 RepID=UPI000E704BCE|nr:protein FAR1-RELATED SEQUENCE 6-like [Papaver somniferum]